MFPALVRPSDTSWVLPCDAISSDCHRKSCFLLCWDVRNIFSVALHKWAMSQRVELPSSLSSLNLLATNSRPWWRVVATVILPLVAATLTYPLYSQLPVFLTESATSSRLSQLYYSSQYWAWELSSLSLLACGAVLRPVVPPAQEAINTTTWQGQTTPSRTTTLTSCHCLLVHSTRLSCSSCQCSVGWCAMDG